MKSSNIKLLQKIENRKKASSKFLEAIVIYNSDNPDKSLSFINIPYCVALPDKRTDAKLTEKIGDTFAVLQ